VDRTECRPNNSGEKGFSDNGMKRGVLLLLRAALICVLGMSLWTATQAKAGAVEYLMVPSASMGRDIPVTFLGGGKHAVFLLDAFNAGESVNNWVTVGNAMNTLADKGISVVAPAGGAFSLYTDWEQDGSRQWETFLSGELPDWLAANKGLAPGGHAVVGASQGGTGALMLAEFHPDRFRYAGSMSGFLYPSNTTVNGALTDGMMRYGGVDIRNMWGLPQLGRWKWHDPYVNAKLLTDNNTRLWIFSPETVSASDPATMIGYADQAEGTNRSFFVQYRGVGGHNGHFDFPASGDHGWSSWAPQLAAMSGDLAVSIK
jgi:S-formylglutathione hydrolase FrmB